MPTGAGRPISARLLALVFCLYAAVAVPTIALLMPPFQAADELAHAQRADEISLGGLVATRYGGDLTSGGMVDTGLAELALPFDPLRFHPEVKVTRAEFERASRIGWGAQALQSFPNTAIYPPFFYLPQALGIAIGRGAGLSLLHTMTLARLLNGAACIALAASAIRIAGPASPLLFALLGLPMTLALFASMSQDGAMIASAALAAALFTSARQTRGRFAGACALIALVAMARPAYLPLCLLPLLVRRAPLRARAWSAGSAVAAVLAWIWLSDRMTLFRPSATHVAAQLHALRLHPGIWTTLVRNMLHDQWTQGLPLACQFIGVLGWLDTDLPNTYYAATSGFLALALLLSRWAAVAATWQARVIAGGLIAVSMAAIFALQYLSWSPISGSTIEGVQGRYFLPLLPALALVLPGRQVSSPFPLVALFCIYPVLSAVITFRAIILRYHL